MLQFVGPFAGKEKDITITSDNHVSVYDFITVFCNQKREAATLLKKEGSEIDENLRYLNIYQKNMSSNQFNNSMI